MHGTPPVPTYNIYSLLHRLGKSLLTTCQLSVGFSCMTHGYGHLPVLGTGGGYNEGDVYINPITSLRVIKMVDNAIFILINLLSV